MYSINLAIIVFVLFLWFNTSKKVKFHNRALWLRKIVENKIRTQILIFLLALCSLSLTIYLHGFGAGIFAWLVYSMGLLSMIILLYPYQLIKKNYLIIIFTFFLLIELSSYYILLH